MTKTEILTQIGCTAKEISNYTRHQSLRQAKKTPCASLRQNYNTCNKKIETYLRELAKAEKSDPRKSQEKKNACVWAKTYIECYIDHSSHLPEGYILDLQIIQEEFLKVCLNGVNGVLPTLNLPDMQVRDAIFYTCYSVVDMLSDNAVPIKWDADSFTDDLSSRLCDLWFTGNTENHEKHHRTQQPVAFPVEFVRSQSLRRVIRETIEEVMVRTFPSMKSAA